MQERHSRARRRAVGPLKQWEEPLWKPKEYEFMATEEHQHAGESLEIHHHGNGSMAARPRSPPI
jgi:hypothetical protein